MKKIIAILMCILLICLVFCGCTDTVVATLEEEVNQDATSMFVKVETFRSPHDGGAYVFYHKDTKVMYIIGYDGVATVMLNPDGTPQTYE